MLLIVFSSLIVTAKSTIAHVSFLGHMFMEENFGSMFGFGESFSTNTSYPTWNRGHCSSGANQSIEERRISEANNQT